jgi:3-deoxy-D-manno-octulosonic-acid transferase
MTPFVDITYAMLLPFVLPFYLLRMINEPAFRAALRDRLTRLPEPRAAGRPRMWLHAVSVGEVMVARTFVAEFEKAFPDWEIVISTVTATGQAVARKTYPGKQIFFLPPDFSFTIERALHRIAPSMLVLVELEVWPNLVLSSAKRGIPVAIINGRITERSARRYRIMAAPMRRVLEGIRLFCVQDREVAGRLKGLGARDDRVRVTGNMKYDAVSLDAGDDDRSRLLQDIGLRGDEPVLVAGSTHGMEERLVFQACLRLLPDMPELRLIVAPRHPGRAAVVESLAASMGLRVFRRTSCRNAGRLPQKSVFILDTVGELRRFYSLATVAFVGGSLVRRGGQNILEPASLGKPVVFGPHMDNFRESADAMLAEGAAVMVRDGDDLERALRELLTDRGRSDKMGACGRRMILGHRGATLRNISAIRECMDTGAANVV